MRRIKLQQKWFIGTCLMLLVLALFALPGFAEKSEGGIFQMTGSIMISKEKVIDGDVEAMAGNITVYGTVNGDVTAMAGNITIFGKVDGNVRSTAGNVYLRDEAEVTGNVTTLAGKIFHDDSAKILGTITEQGGSQLDDDDIQNLREKVWNTDFYMSPKIPWVLLIWGTITGLISALAIAALLMLFFAKNVNIVADEAQKRPLYYFLVGLLAYLLFPPVVLITAVTVLGIPIALLAILLVFFASILGQLSVASIVGAKVIETFKWEQKTDMFRVLIGTLTMYLISIIPLVGWLFFLICACIGFGTIIITRFGLKKKEES